MKEYKFWFKNGTSITGYGNTLIEAKEDAHVMDERNFPLDYYEVDGVRHEYKMNAVEKAIQEASLGLPLVTGVVAETISEHIQPLEPISSFTNSDIKDDEPPHGSGAIQIISSEVVGGERMKLTKAAIAKFLVWSSSRYNDWLNYGTKKENVELVYHSLLNGYYTDGNKRKDASTTRFTVQCAGGTGETWNGKSFRYWKTKQSGEEYHVDCENKTIEAKYSKRRINFK